MSSFHSWLPMALPAATRRVRTADADIADVLRSVGIEVGAVAPDVEIVSRPREIRGDAPVAVVSIGRGQAPGGAKIVRVARRFGHSAGTRAAALAASVRLRRRGYRDVSVLLWDFDQPIRPATWRFGARRIAELIPERAIVIARRGAPGDTMAGAVVAAAGAATGGADLGGHPQVRAGVLVTVAPRHVLRTAVGPAGRRLEDQRRILDLLAGCDAVVADRLPTPALGGTVGAATWSVERRLPGRVPVGSLSARIAADCVAFLTALHRVSVTGPERSLTDDARRFAARCSSAADAAALIRVGADLDARLRDLPRGFAHGDFWQGNLIVEGDRLTGVIDWDGAGPGRLPLLDLIHLQMSAGPGGTHESLGEGVLAQLRVAASGGDPLMRDYCARMRLPTDAPLLEALVLAFWIERTALELELRPDTITRGWIDRTLATVLATLRRPEAGSSGGPRI